MPNKKKQMDMGEFQDKMRLSIQSKMKNHKQSTPKNGSRKRSDSMYSGQNLAQGESAKTTRNTVAAGGGLPPLLSPKSARQGGKGALGSNV
jgi:hypothetical protein